MAKRNDPEQHAYLRSLRYLVPMYARAAGWNATVRNAEACAGPSAYFYAFDQPTNKIWMAAISLEGLSAIEQHCAAFSADDVTVVREATGLLIHTMAMGGKIEGIDEGDFEINLGAALTAYAMTTQTYRMFKDRAEGGHFIVLNYRHPGAQDSMLRPFVAPDSSGVPLPVEDVRQFAQRVVEIDRQNHPEWFAASH